MMTDKQLEALLIYIDLKSGSYLNHVPTPLHEVRAARRAAVEAFGFETDRRGYKIEAKSQRRHDQHCNCVGCTTYRDADAATARQQARNPIREGSLDAWPSVIVGVDPAKEGADTTIVCEVDRDGKITRVVPKEDPARECGGVTGAGWAEDRMREFLKCHNALNPSASQIVRLWPQMKEIMEPASDICRGCGCKRGEVHAATGPSARGTCARVQLEWEGAL